jgi:hypothetical protein
MNAVPGSIVRLAQQRKRFFGRRAFGLNFDFQPISDGSQQLNDQLLMSCIDRFGLPAANASGCRNHVDDACIWRSINGDFRQFATKHFVFQIRRGLNQPCLQPHLGAIGGTGQQVHDGFRSGGRIPANFKPIRRPQTGSNHRLLCSCI